MKITISICKKSHKMLCVILKGSFLKQLAVSMHFMYY